MSTPIPKNDAAFTLEAVARATGGAVAMGDPGSTMRGVVIDSRAVELGCLFVALRGERHDAHRFVEDAARAGAAAVLVERRGRIPADLGAAVVEVEDTTRALGDLGRAHRDAWGGTVVAITGSAGKTTTKELTAAALEGTGARVHRTRGNLNNLYGVPMTLFELGADHDVAVVELGTNRPGEIARLAEIARPDVAVVTLVAAAHTEGLGSLEAVAEEKWSLVEALHPDGAAVVNGDDGSLRRLAGRAGARLVWFGRAEGADVRVLSHQITDTLHTRVALGPVPNAGGGVALGTGPNASVELGLVGEAAALDAAAALGVVVVALGRDVEAAGAGMARVRPGPGRMRPLWAANGALVLDDTYNANPRSMALALDTAVEVARQRGGGVLAVLGDMKELGERSADEHAAIGRHAARAGVRVLAACGPEMRYAAAAARQARGGMEVHHFLDPVAMVGRLAEEAGRNDVVLVKGSRSMRMERVVEALALEGTA